MDKKKKTKVAVTVGIIVVLVALMTLYSNNNSVRQFFDKYIFRKEVYENNLPTIKIENVSTSNIYAYDGKVAVLEKNLLTMYNKSGIEQYAIEMKINNPIFDSSAGYLCVAEKEGKQIYLIYGKNIVWQKELEAEILGICVNKNGYVSANIADTIHKSIIETYDKNGTKLFKNYIPTSSVIDIDISNNNKYLAIAEVNSSGVVIRSSVKIISIENAGKEGTESIVYTRVAEPGDLIIDIKYNNKNNLICMYDGYIDKIENNQNNILLTFEHENLLFADINLNTNIIKVVKKANGVFSSESELQIIESNNIQNSKTYTIEDTPKQVYTYGNMICINAGTEVLFINNNGWLVKKYMSSQEVQEVVLCDNVAGIIYKNKIELVSL